MSSPWSSLIFLCQIDNFQQSGGAPDCQNGPTDRFLGMIRITMRNEEREAHYSREALSPGLDFAYRSGLCCFNFRHKGTGSGPGNPTTNNRHFGSGAPPFRRHNGTPSDTESVLPSPAPQNQACQPPLSLPD